MNVNPDHRQFAALVAVFGGSSAFFWWLRGKWERRKRDDAQVSNVRELHPMPREVKRGG